MIYKPMVWQFIVKEPTKAQKIIKRRNKNCQGANIGPTKNCKTTKWQLSRSQVKSGPRTFVSLGLPAFLSQREPPLSHQFLCKLRTGKRAFPPAGGQPINILGTAKMWGKSVL